MTPEHAHQEIVSQFEGEIKRLKLKIGSLELGLEKVLKERDELRQAIGLLTTLHPRMELNAADPVGMARIITNHVSQEMKDAWDNFRLLREEEIEQREELTRARELLERVRRIECDHTDHHGYCQYWLEGNCTIKLIDDFLNPPAAPTETDRPSSINLAKDSIDLPETSEEDNEWMNAPMGKPAAKEKPKIPMIWWCEWCDCKVDDPGKHPCFKEHSSIIAPILKQPAPEKSVDLRIYVQADLIWLVALKKYLDKYAKHKAECAFFMNDGHPCYCGLDAALNGFPELPARDPGAKA